MKRDVAENVRGGPLTWRLWKSGRRIRRHLGLPILSRRTWLLVVLAFLGLIYVGVTVVADFVMKIGRYAPQYYEPKDVQREDVRRE